MSDPQTGRPGRPQRAGAEGDKRYLFERLVEFLSPGPDSRAQMIENFAEAEHRSLIEPESRAMLEGVLRMADMTAGDVMVAAPRMDLLSIDAPYDELLAAVIGTGHSRFPVYEGQRENILGTLMAKDLLKLQRAPELNLRTLLRPAVFVPESKNLNELLREFRSNRNHLAIVIDEFGNTAGLLTIEDVLEEIVGEIEDEFDDADAETGVYALADGSMRVAGNATIAEVNHAFDVALPEDAFDTIGGIVSHELGHVPRRGETTAPGRPAVLRDADARRRRALVQGDAPGARQRFAASRRARRVTPRAPRSPRRSRPVGERLDGVRAGGAGRRRAGAVVRADRVLVVAADRHRRAGGVAGRAAPRASPRAGPGRSASAGSATGFWWLYISLHVYGFLPAWLSTLAVGVLAALLALYYALAGWAWARMRRGRPFVDALLFAAFWLLAELARGSFLTGFPWIAGGYAHTSGPLAAWAPYIGVYGIGALAAGISAAVALSLLTLRDARSGRGRVTLSPLLLPLAVLVLGAALPQIVHAVDGHARASRCCSRTWRRTTSSSRRTSTRRSPGTSNKLNAAPGQLVVTPESSLPVLPVQIPTTPGSPTSVRSTCPQVGTGGRVHR